jgi:hypothetical protein
MMNRFSWIVPSVLLVLFLVSVATNQPTLAIFGSEKYHDELIVWGIMFRTILLWLLTFKRRFRNLWIVIYIIASLKIGIGAELLLFPLTCMYITGLFTKETIHETTFTDVSRSRSKSKSKRRRSKSPRVTPKAIYFNEDDRETILPSPQPIQEKIVSPPSARNTIVSPLVHSNVVDGIDVLHNESVLKAKIQARENQEARLREKVAKLSLSGK